jgi:hypothetical protein
VRGQGELAAALNEAVRSGDAADAAEVVALPGVDVIQLLLESADLGHLVVRAGADRAVAEHSAEKATAPMEYVR